MKIHEIYEIDENSTCISNAVSVSSRKCSI